MNQQRRFPLLLLVCLLFISASAHAGVPDRAELLKKDPRLAQKVTFAKEKARLGEVLDAATQQTGVHLYASDRDGAAGEIVAVYVRDLPLVDLITALWSLVSYRQAPFSWQVEQDTAQSPLEYHLVRPNVARDYPQNLMKDILEYHIRMLEEKIRCLQLSREEVEEVAKTYPEVRCVLDERCKRKMLAFVSLFATPDARRGLFTTDFKRQIPRSQWTPELQDYATGEVKIRRQSNTGRVIPDYDVVGFSFSYTRSALSPDLWVSFEGGGVPVAGSIYTEALWQERIKAEWICPGDLKDDPNRELVVIPQTPPRPRRPDEPAPRTIPTGDGGSIIRDPANYPLSAIQRLVRVHKLTGMPILARLQGADATVAADIDESTAKILVTHLRESRMMTKWRDGVLLVSYPGWLRIAADFEPLKAPWEPLREFRDAVSSDPEEGPTLKVMCRLASLIPAPQLMAIDEQNLSPLALSQSSPFFFRTLAELHPVLAELNKRPELVTSLLSPGGIPVRSLPRAVQEYVKPMLDEKLPSDVIVRLTEEENLPQKVTGAYPDFRYEPLSLERFTRWRYWRLQLVKQGTPEQIIKEYPFFWSIRERHQPPTPDELDLYRLEIR